MKVLLTAAFILTVSFSAMAQTKVTEDLTLNPGVARHAGIDSVYKRFSKAYRDLDHKVFAELYSGTAAYLAPNDDIKIGGSGIVKTFEDFFNGVRSRQQQMTISFEIVQRKVEGGIGYDVGIYTLNTYKDNVRVGGGRGKFVVVALREGDRWVFQVDGYSDMPSPKSGQ